MPRYQRPVNMSYLSGKLKVLRPNSCISSFYSKNLYSNFAVGIHLPKDAYNQNFSPLAQTGAEISRRKSRHFFWIRSFPISEFIALYVEWKTAKKRILILTGVKMRILFFADRKFNGKFLSCQIVSMNKSVSFLR